MLYQYHDRLGLHVATANWPGHVSLARQLREAQRDRNGLDAQVKRLLDAGRNREATDLLYELVRLSPETRDYNERYRSVLRTTHNTLLLLHFGDSGEARRLLEEIVQRPGNDPVMVQAREYLAALPKGPGAD